MSTLSHDNDRTEQACVANIVYLVDLSVASRGQNTFGEARQIFACTHYDRIRGYEEQSEDVGIER